MTAMAVGGVLTSAPTPPPGCRRLEPLLIRCVRRSGRVTTPSRRRERGCAGKAPPGAARAPSLPSAAYGGAEVDAKRGWREAKARTSSVFADLLERPAPDLTLSDLQLAVDAHPSKSSAAAAVRYLRPMLKWGAKRGLCPKGIAGELEQPRGASRPRSRYLTDLEIKAVLTALSTPELAGGYADCIRWLFWTACRLDEAVGATFGEIEADLWLIPSSRTKSTRDHTIPLPRQALAFLQDRGRSPGDLLFPNSSGGRLENWPKYQRRLFALTSTAGWHRHDIRRTVATRLGDMGVAPHVIEVVLGHAVSHTALATVYNRSRYLAEHRDALQQFADRLGRI
jgi:integrase